MPDPCASPADLEAREMRALIAQARTGDPDAFCELCRFFETRLLRQAFTLCRNAAMAEDLAQETLVEAWKSLHRFQGRCQFFTWLCAILLNRYRNAVRQKRPVPVSSLPHRDQEAVALTIDHATDAEPLPDQSAQAREDAHLMLQCIQALPAKHQEVVYLRFYVHDSLEEIAAALDCSVGTIKSRLFRALESLRSMTTLRADRPAPQPISKSL